MTGQSRLSLSSLSSSIHSSLFRPFSPSPHPYIYIYIYVQTPRERGGRKRDRTRGTRVDRRRIKPMRSLQLCSLSFSLRLSLRGYAPFDALGDVHTIKQGNTRDKGGSKRTLRLGAQPSRLPPRILRETYCLRISIFRATQQTQLFFLSFYSSFSFPFFLVCFVSFRFHSLSSFLFFFLLFSLFSYFFFFFFFPLRFCNFGSRHVVEIRNCCISRDDDVFAPLLKIFYPATRIPCLCSSSVSETAASSIRDPPTCNSKDFERMFLSRVFFELQIPRADIFIRGRDWSYVWILFFTVSARDGHRHNCLFLFWNSV